MCPHNKAALTYKPKADFLSWTERDIVRKYVFERDPPICAWCQNPVGDHRSGSYYTVDHIVVRSEGGSLHPDNLVLACSDCNRHRGNMSVLEYLMFRGQLEYSDELKEAA